MANYIAYARSNYFKVKDEQKFIDEIVNKYGLDFNKNDDGIALFPEEDWPMYDWYNDETDDWEEVDFEGELCEHLVDGEVAILQHIGFEKMRYLGGYSTAIKSDGEVLSVSIGDIYDKVYDEWKVKPTYAEY